jgi:hypothetical protein
MPNLVVGVAHTGIDLGCATDSALYMMVIMYSANMIHVVLGVNASQDRSV